MGGFDPYEYEREQNAQICLERKSIIRTGYGAGGLDFPVPALRDAVEFEKFRELAAGERTGQVLFVGKDEQRRACSGSGAQRNGTQRNAGEKGSYPEQKHGKYKPVEPRNAAARLCLVYPGVVCGEPAATQHHKKYKHAR